MAQKTKKKKVNFEAEKGMKFSLVFRYGDDVYNIINNAIETGRFAHGEHDNLSAIVRWCIRHAMDGKRTVKLAEVHGLIKHISENREPLAKALFDVTAANDELTVIGRNLDQLGTRVNAICKMYEKSAKDGGDKQLLQDLEKVANKLLDFRTEISQKCAAVVTAHEKARQDVSNALNRENEILRRALI